MSSDRHITHLGVHRGLFHPGCSCGWPGTATRWTTDAERQLNAHLASVAKPALPPLVDRRGKARQRWVGMSSSPTGDSAA